MTISFRQLLSAYLCFMGMTLLIGFFSNGESSLFNTYTLLLSLSIIITLFVSLHLASKLLFSEIAILIIFIGIFFLPRIVCYLFIPDTISFAYGDSISAAYVNHGLAFILIGTISIILGFFISQSFYLNHSSNRKVVAIKHYLPSIKSLVILFFIASLFDFWLISVMKMTIFEESKGPFHYLLTGIRTVFGNDTVFFFLLAALITSKSKSKKNQILLWVTTLIYGIQMTASGSKGAVLRIGMTFLFMTLCRLGNIRIRSIILIPAILISLLVGLVTFAIGLSSRVQLKTDGAISTSQSIEAATKIIQEGESLNMLTFILDRIGTLDYPISIIARPETNETPTIYYLTLPYLFKSLINILLPGTPYSDAVFPTNRLLPVIYGFYEEETLEISFNSEPWTIWGASYAYFGWIGGGLFILVMAGCLHFLLLILANLPSWSPQLRLLTQSALLFWIIFGAFYNCMGLDYAVGQSLFIVLQITAIYILGHSLDIFTKKWNRIFQNPKKLSYE